MDVYLYTDFLHLSFLFPGWERLWCRHRWHSSSAGFEETEEHIPWSSVGLWCVPLPVYISWPLWLVSHLHVVLLSLIFATKMNHADVKDRSFSKAARRCFHFYWIRDSSHIGTVDKYTVHVVWHSKNWKTNYSHIFLYYLYLQYTIL